MCGAIIFNFFLFFLLIISARVCVYVCVYACVFSLLFYRLCVIRLKWSLISFSFAFFFYYFFLKFILRHMFKPWKTSRFEIRQRFGSFPLFSYYIFFSSFFFSRSSSYLFLSSFFFLQLLSLFHYVITRKRLYRPVECIGVKYVITYTFVLFLNIIDSLIDFFFCLYFADFLFFFPFDSFINKFFIWLSVMIILSSSFSSRKIENLWMLLSSRSFNFLFSFLYFFLVVRVRIERIRAEFDPSSRYIIFFLAFSQKGFTAILRITWTTFNLLLHIYRTNKNNGTNGIFNEFSIYLLFYLFLRSIIY